MRLFPARTFVPLCLALALALAVTFGAPLAHAQGHSERMANIAAEHAHAQQMYDYGRVAAENDANSQNDNYEEEEDTGYYGSYDSAGPGTPITREMQYLIESARRELDEFAAIQADPQYQRYVNGGWDFYQMRSPAEPGEYCAATYLSKDGMITLAGVDSSWDGGMLIFVGPNIPRPDTFQEITATLTQTDEAPATVRVYNYERKPGMEELGTLIFAVPTMDAALAGMTEELELAVSIEGQEVFRMSYKDGLAARDELRKCVDQRR